MRYCHTDYHTLLILSRTGRMTAEELLRDLHREYGWSACVTCLASSLSALLADEYITWEPQGKITPETIICITDKGEGATYIRGVAKVFGGMRKKAIRKNTAAFCDLDRPQVPLPAIDQGSFSEITRQMEHDRQACLFWIDDTEDGPYAFTLHSPYYSEDDRAEDESQADGLSIYCDAAEIHTILKDLLDTALLFVESRKIRKIVLSGTGRAYVLTFCEVADETGEPVMRVSAAPILFNRQRFIGRRDSELDYAQCGSDVVSTHLSSIGELCGIILGVASSRVDLLDEELGERVHKLSKLLL